MTIHRICCIGAGYVGGPTMAVIADRCPQVQVQVVDINQARIDAWNDADLRCPCMNRGSTVLWTGAGRNLHFSTDVASSIAAADMVFISVNTHQDKDWEPDSHELRWVKPMHVRWLKRPLVIPSSSRKAPCRCAGCCNQDHPGGSQ